MTFAKITVVLMESCWSYSFPNSYFTMSIYWITKVNKRQLQRLALSLTSYCLICRRCVIWSSKTNCLRPSGNSLNRGPPTIPKWKWCTRTTFPGCAISWRPSTRRGAGWTTAWRTWCCRWRAARKSNVTRTNGHKQVDHKGRPEAQQLNSWNSPAMSVGLRNAD